jgi:hypothetical protein
MVSRGISRLCGSIRFFPMQNKPIPEIDETDLKAARDFLTSLRDEERGARAARIPLDARGAVTLRNGIARARMRSASRTPA